MNPGDRLDAVRRNRTTAKCKLAVNAAIVGQTRRYRKLHSGRQWSVDRNRLTVTARSGSTTATRISAIKNRFEITKYVSLM